MYFVQNNISPLFSVKSTIFSTINCNYHRLFLTDLRESNKNAFIFIKLLHVIKPNPSDGVLRLPSYNDEFSMPYWIKSPHLKHLSNLNQDNQFLEIFFVKGVN